MAQVRYPRDYPIDFTSEIADRDTATKLASEISAMLAAVVSSATTKPQASLETIRDRLQQAGDAWSSTHAGTIPTLMVYTATPWSHACIRSKAGGHTHVGPIDLQTELVVVSTHRNNGWLHLQVEPAVHLGNA